MKWIKGFSLTLCLISVALFATLAVNQQPVSLRFLDWTSPPVDLFWWLLGAFGFGVLVGWLMAGYSLLRMKFAERRALRDKDAARAELDSLKVAPPSGPTETS